MNCFNEIEETGGTSERRLRTTGFDLKGVELIKGLFGRNSDIAPDIDSILNLNTLTGETVMYLQRNRARAVSGDNVVLKYAVNKYDSLSRHSS